MFSSGISPLRGLIDANIRKYSVKLLILFQIILAPKDVYFLFTVTNTLFNPFQSYIFPALVLSFFDTKLTCSTSLPTTDWFVSDTSCFGCFWYSYIAYYVLHLTLVLFVFIWVGVFTSSRNNGLVRWKSKKGRDDSRIWDYFYYKKSYFDNQPVVKAQFKLF